MFTINTHKQGKKTVIDSIIYTNTGEEYKPLFDDYKHIDDYLEADIPYYEPMTAKEYLSDEMLEEMASSPNYIAEEKLDGLRQLLYIDDVNRLFSRNISKHTGWSVENSDKLPHIRDLKISPDYYGTILDGELIIKNHDFKTVSSTVNCNYDEAIYRQEQFGYATLFVFDIIQYCGKDVRNLPLYKRKALLEDVVKTLGSKYVENVKFTNKLIVKPKCSHVMALFNNDEGFKVKYPNLYEALVNSDNDKLVTLNKKAWYEYIIVNGGEGLMLKDINGEYYNKRHRNYTKWKKFITRDVVIVDYNPPTVDYTGKGLRDDNFIWHYWYSLEDSSYILHEDMTMKQAREQRLLPCTKSYAYDWIGTICYGVLIDDRQLKYWEKKNPKETPDIREVEGQKYLVVGNCGGINDNIVSYISDNKEELLGTVIEVGANEILKTGKLRHPRFIRFRTDKSNSECDLFTHMGI